MADMEFTPDKAAADLRIRAAIGYLELGMLTEAWEELGELDRVSAERPSAVEVRTLLLLREENWEAGLEESRKLCGLRPEAPAGYIHQAYCLHELDRTPEAERLLLAGPASLRTEPVYFYNLGCYKAVLGDIDDAESLIRRSFAMDRRLVDVARQDPDLRSIWDRL